MRPAYAGRIGLRNHFTFPAGGNTKTPVAFLSHPKRAFIVLGGRGFPGGVEVRGSWLAPVRARPTDKPVSWRSASFGMLHLDPRT